MAYQLTIFPYHEIPSEIRDHYEAIFQYFEENNSSEFIYFPLNYSIDEFDDRLDFDRYAEVVRYMRAVIGDINAEEAMISYA